jgi:uncharacterized protein (DUF2062 family)
LKFLRLRGDSRSLARGTAVGAFLAITPIMPVRTVAIIVSTTLVRASTVAALITATLISNPLTYIPLYFGAVFTGNAITPYTLNWERIEIVLAVLVSSDGFSVSVQSVASLGLEAFIVLMVGGVALAIPVSLITYSLSLHFFTARKNRSSFGEDNHCDS